MIAALAAGALVLVLALRFRPRPARVDDIAARAQPTWRPSGVGRAGQGGGRPAWRHAVSRRRRVRPEPADIAEWCGRLSSACRSGSTLTAAVRSADPPATGGDTVGELQLAVERGTPLAAAIDRNSPSEHLDVALTVVRACATSGAPPAEPLDRAAAALRARAAEAADRATHSAQARLSAVVMTVLPVAMLGLLLATSTAVGDAALTPVGLGCVAAGAVLNVAGWRWMRRIIERASR